MFLATARAAGLPCALCGRADPPPDSVDHRYPVSWEVPGIDPMDPAHWQPAHRSCNHRRQARPALPRLNTSRQW